VINGSGVEHPTNYEDYYSKTDIEIYDYTLIDRFIEQSELVICHTGAGTILECLQKQKKVVSVVNDLLMDNH